MSPWACRKARPAAGLGSVSQSASPRPAKGSVPPPSRSVPQLQSRGLFRRTPPSPAWRSLLSQDVLWALVGGSISPDEEASLATQPWVVASQPGDAPSGPGGGPLSHHSLAGTHVATQQCRQACVGREGGHRAEAWYGELSTSKEGQSVGGCSSGWVPASNSGVPHTLGSGWNPLPCASQCLQSLPQHGSIPNL